jgi:hypothetical protein
MRTCIWSVLIALMWHGVIGALEGVQRASAAPTAAAPAAVASHAAQGPSNILYIMSDQQRFDALGVVNPSVRTPALDRLLKEGVRFDRTYVAQALCTLQGHRYSQAYTRTRTSSTITFTESTMY